MGCCKDTFAGLSEVKERERAKHLAEAHPEAECEAISVGSHGNGPVSDSEFLIRLCLYKIHFNEDGELNSTAADEVYQHGLSTSRRALLHDRDLARQITNKRKALRERGSRNDVVDVAVILARDVRQIIDQETQVRELAVYDTSREENPAHADIFGARFPDKTIRRSVREELASLLTRGLVNSLEPDKIFASCDGNSIGEKSDASPKSKWAGPKFG